MKQIFKIINYHNLKFILFLISIPGMLYACKKVDGPNDNNNIDTTVVAMYGVPTAKYVEIDTEGTSNSHKLELFRQSKD